ncbi:MAG: nucleotide kinase domain-containing protein, partial [Nostoc sp.]
MVTKRQKQSSENTGQDKQLSLDIGNSGEKAISSPVIISHISPIKPTVVFNTYWQFAAERQKIFFKKLENAPMPWTDDTILSTYKFTNAYRASD